MPEALKDFFYIFGLISYGFLALAVLITVILGPLFIKVKRVIKSRREK